MFPINAFFILSGHGPPRPTHALRLRSSTLQDAVDFSKLEHLSTCNSGFVHERTAGKRPLKYRPATMNESLFERSAAEAEAIRLGTLLYVTALVAALFGSVRSWRPEVRDVVFLLTRSLDRRHRTAGHGPLSDRTTAAAETSFYLWTVMLSQAWFPMSITAWLHVSMGYTDLASIACSLSTSSSRWSDWRRLLAPGSSGWWSIVLFAKRATLRVSAARAHDRGIQFPCCCFIAVSAVTVGKRVWTARFLAGSWVFSVVFILPLGMIFALRAMDAPRGRPLAAIAQVLSPGVAGLIRHLSCLTTWRQP